MMDGAVPSFSASGRRIYPTGFPSLHFLSIPHLLLRPLFKAAQHAATCSLPTHLANENSTHARTY